MVTTSIRYKHQQITDNTEHSTQNCNCTTNTNTQHLHDKTHIILLPIKELLQLHASHIKQKLQSPTNPLHYSMQ